MPSKRTCSRCAREGACILSLPLSARRSDNQFIQYVRSGSPLSSLVSRLSSRHTSHCDTWILTADTQRRHTRHTVVAAAVTAAVTLTASIEIAVTVARPRQLPCDLRCVCVTVCVTRQLTEEAVPAV
jgi:hypothetical protein